MVRLWTAVLVAIIMSVSDPGLASLLRRLADTELIELSERIFHGRVVKITTLADGEMPIQSTEFEVIDRLKGVMGRRLTIEQPQLSEPVRARMASLISQVVLVEGMEVVVFLPPSSAQGYTAPILGGGIFRVFRQRHGNSDQALVHQLWPSQQTSLEQHDLPSTRKSLSQIDSSKVAAPVRSLADLKRKIALELLSSELSPK